MPFLNEAYYSFVTDASPATRGATQATVSPTGRTGVRAVQALERCEDLCVGEHIAGTDDQGSLAV